MVIKHGEIWWAKLPEPVGSVPGYKRPLLIVQANEFNKSRISTIIAVALTTNLRLAEAPGNILLSSKQSKLPRKSVVNISQIITIDKSFLTERVHTLSSAIMATIEDGMRLVLKL
ncbi:MAG: type II toxin-antitoxin system PemK/MazF family toxin [Pseudomonadota bacterium]|nr:type II toxin-antitoxin system PemK/MazF family toxin [Pseudomonadota bacterium]MEA3239991.1 type II toxin-antitoxin system PemK/MazF family toxin [Pseudomonadota bacterium]